MLREDCRRASRTLELSERRVCRATGQPRSTRRYEGTKAATDRPLVEAMGKDLAQDLAQDLTQDEGRFSDLVVRIVTSRQFRYRRL